jgi:hypothetical protein
MPITRRVYVSMPADKWLAKNQNELKWAIVHKIEALGYETEVFFDPRGKPSLAAACAWNAVEADLVARRCVGVALIGLPRWQFVTEEGQVKLPTEFCHYEGALACTLKLPILSLVQEDVLHRGVFDHGYKGYLGEFPADAGPAWLKTKAFLTPFRYWKVEMSKRSDVFLGYSGTSAGTAKNLKRFLQAKLGLKVLDWVTDFAPARSILQQIEQAAALCSAGIFLFTTDDKFADENLADKAAPRDNVVFEAGYFTGVKGKDHVLVIREKGAKMPADLGGDIYAPLDDKADIRPIEDLVRRFVENL